MQQPFHASLRTMDAELLMICLASNQYNQLANNLVDILLDFISIAKLLLNFKQGAVCFEFLSEKTFRLFSISIFIGDQSVNPS